LRPPWDYEDPTPPGSLIPKEQHQELPDGSRFPDPEPARLDAHGDRVQQVHLKQALDRMLIQVSDLTLILTLTLTMSLIESDAHLGLRGGRCRP